MNIEFRKANDNDLNDINNLLEKNFGDNHSIEKIIDDEYKYSFVASIHNKVVGYVNVTKLYNEVKKEYWIKLNYICVDEEYRHQGIATKLLEELEKVENSVKYFELTCRKERINAHKLYNKLGFEIYDTDLLRKNINF